MTYTFYISPRCVAWIFSSFMCLPFTTNLFNIQPKPFFLCYEGGQHISELLPLLLTLHHSHLCPQLGAELTCVFPGHEFLLEVVTTCAQLFPVMRTLAWELVLVSLTNSIPALPKTCPNSRQAHLAPSPSLWLVDTRFDFDWWRFLFPVWFCCPSRLSIWPWLPS